MIIVAGHLRVRPDERDAYLAAARPVIVQARSAAGCIDFHLSADPLDPDRINVFEQWESADAVESFRGSGPESGSQDAVIGAAVAQHEISTTTWLT